ncbi:MAG: exodeoxyribonuclease VII small subunit [Clostridiales Family XIII bacterium]|jgi:exodeoxyribonuclease VII small subunit|nr:exodeoxyribonuclease VII small subunit [Clostridiales Family XIII bacterium]
MTDKKLTFEEALEKLESCADRITSKDATIEEAIAAYEEGALYYEQCERVLKDAKQRIEKIGAGTNAGSYPGEEG